MHSIVDAIFEKVSGERAAWRALRWIMAYYFQRSAMGAVALTALETRIASPRSGLERAVLGSNRSGDSRISEFLIQPVGWAEASRRWQSRIRKICVIA